MHAVPCRTSLTNIGVPDKREEDNLLNNLMKKVRKVIP